MFQIYKRNGWKKKENCNTLKLKKMTSKYIYKKYTL